jgi:hypothetical protein
MQAAGDDERRRFLLQQQQQLCYGTGIWFEIAPNVGSQPAPGQAAAVLNACRLEAEQPKQQQLQQQLVVELAAANSASSRR